MHGSFLLLFTSYLTLVALVTETLLLLFCFGWPSPNYCAKSRHLHE
jgi:hypothetical protein